MKSTSHSRGNRRSTSRERNTSRRETDKCVSKKRPHSKSRSPPSHGAAGRRQSSDASGSPKRWHSSVANDNKVALREADSTVFARKRKSSPLPQDFRQPKARSRTPKQAGARNAKPAGGEKRKREHSPHSRSTSDQLKTKPEERVSKHHGASGDDKSGTDKRQSRKTDPERKEQDDSRKLRTYDQTDITLDDRFSKLSLSTKPFVPDENITIEIERTVDGRSIPFEYPKFFSDAVVVIRHSNEGKKPLSDREEFKHRVDDEEERRTVKVTKSVVQESIESHRTNSDFRHQKRGERHERGMSSRWAGDRGHDSRGRRAAESRVYEDAKDLVVSMRREDTGGRNRRTERNVMTASAVGRQYLLPAAAVITGELPLNPLRQQAGPQRESAKSRLGTTQQEIQTYRASAIPAQLPDFSHRPDKYRYEEWKDRPELIPRSGSYYEHDDREKWDNPRFQGRGRGRGGRGRGGWSRGGFDRPRIQPRQPESQMESWKHDKFEEMECGQGQQ